MPLSNPVIRRYTPPTCTLEVLAQSSPLSRWMGKSVLKQVRFNLRFDDPRQPEEELVVVQGDRDQLEILHTAVSGYVQEILQQSPENFWASRVEAPKTINTSQPTAVGDVLNPEGDIKRENIYLQPSSNLTHQLFLGSLASPVSGSSIQLSLLQLFDLATALDEYMADVVALPTETQETGRNRLAVPAWAPVAAVLVLGLGLMPLTYQYANRLREQNKTGEKIATADKKIGENAISVPSLEPLPTPTSLLTPSPNLSPLPLGTGLNVPSNASLPTPGASPVPTVGATQKPGVASSTNSSNSSSNIPLPPLGSNSFGSNTAKKPQIGQNLVIPNSPSTKTNTGLATKPNLEGNSSASLPRSRTSLPSPTLPSSLPSASLPSLRNPAKPKLPELPTQGSASPQINKNQGNSLANSSKSTSELLSQLRTSRADSAANNGEQSTATTAAASRETLFDTNQVAEVRNYLKQRWQPPSGLKQPLQYSLTVGVDGALEQILPLGKAARDYVDRAGIPQIGQPFVSPSRNGQNVKIRAVFKPNGQVQTFPETD
ncbi:hypothetical protein NIES267_58660 [Calothrix parasitica NIES-267]|uniref:DUF4335 domain-containing protein n=1 Tax=Calothrix parasitica NIES-267 TaxID=1973488 RepID=A0A1Z4LYR5_9CYAN|nr:hypothetical protein NIES267_58660 [Calothrix parasitica NIES-267]